MPHLWPRSARGYETVLYRPHGHANGLNRLAHGSRRSFHPSIRVPREPAFLARVHG